MYDEFGWIASKLSIGLLAEQAVELMMGRRMIDVEDEWLGVGEAASSLSSIFFYWNVDDDGV